MKTQTLAVFSHLGEPGQDSLCVPAGLLDITERGVEVVAATFRYGTRYIDRPNAIDVDPVSLSLADKEAVRGRELLPAEGLALFGAIRDAAPDAWGRRVIEARLKAPLNGLPESAYLLEAGSERAGALDIRASIDAPAAEARSSIRRLEYLMEAAERIEQGLPVPAQLDDIFLAGSQLGGMRPKARVEDDAGVQWLAKFSSHGELLNIPELEVATLRLAQDAGLDVPRVALQPMGRKSVMLIRRFDREYADGITYRRHQVSALTLLGGHEADASRRSYAVIADAIRRYGDPERIRHDCLELFGRMVFNIFVTNDDDHLRNHAFLCTPAVRAWRLSPLYDVVPRPMVASERFLHLDVGRQGRLATLDNALSDYARFGITLEDANTVIDRIWRVVREWKVRFEGYGVSGPTITRVAPAFRHIDDLLTRQPVARAHQRGRPHST